MENCKLCQNNHNLENSHAIPDTVFKKIYREDNGKGIVVPSAGDDPIKYSSDSWATQQLCSTCESNLNTNYENYALKIIRGKRGQAQRHENGVTFSNIKTSELFNFFVSVFWRAANSDHEAYLKVISPEPWNEELRKCLLNNEKVPSNLLSIKVSRLIDYTANGGFTLEALRSLIMSPFFRKYKRGKYSFCFVMGATSIFTPALKHIERNQAGVLKCLKSIFMAPFLDIFDVPECASSGA